MNRGGFASSRGVVCRSGRSKASEGVPGVSPRPWRGGAGKGGSGALVGGATAPRPPSTNRGVEQTTNPLQTLLEGVECSRTIDWLALVLGGCDDAWLRGHDSIGKVLLDGAAPKWPGFRDGEWLEGLGGRLQRMSSPFQESSRHGLSYALWVFRDGTQYTYPQLLRGRGQATRVDVAFDFKVPAEVSALSFVNGTEVLRKSCYREPSLVGKPSECTAYLGSPKATRRVRIYRKDLEGKGRALRLAPTLRIEAQLRGEAAESFWDSYGMHDEGGFTMAAGVIEDICGVVVQQERERWSAPVKPVRADAVFALGCMLRMYGGLMADLSSFGVDVVSLAKLSNSLRPSSLATAGRADVRRRHLKDAIDVLGVKAFGKMAIAAAHESRKRA